MDHPDIKFNEHESTQMPFRYVTDKDGKPIVFGKTVAGFTSEEEIAIDAVKVGLCSVQASCDV